MMDFDNDNSQLEPVQDDFYLDDWLNELGAGDIQDKNNPTGMEGIQESSSSPSNPNQRNNIFANMEDRLCQGSAKKPESVSGICQQMMPVDGLYRDSSAVMSSDSGLFKQTTTEALDQSSNLWNMSVHPMECISNPGGQAMQSSTIPRSQPLQQASQGHQRHQLRKQILKQKTLQPYNQPPLPHANTQYAPQKLQNHIVPDQLHPSQLLLRTLQNQRQMGQLQNQQTLGLQSKFRGLQPQQQIFQPQSDVLGPKTHQYPFHPFQQLGSTTPQQNFQKTSNPMHLNFPQTGITNNPNNTILDGMQQTSQNSATLRRHQSVNIGEQQKPLEQSQGAYPEGSSGNSGASVDCTVHSEHAALSDWYDQAYQQIQTMKENCLPDLVRLYKKAHELSLQSPNAESAEKYERMKTFINKMIVFLKISRAELIPYPKEKVMNYIQYITNYIRTVRSKIATSMQHHEQLRPDGNMSDAPQLPPEGNLKLQLNQLLGSPQMVPTIEMNMTNSMPNVSFPGPEKGNAPKLFQYGSGRWPLQTNGSNHSSQMRTDQRTFSPLQIGSFKSTNQNGLSMQQHTNSSSRNHVSISSAPTTTIFPFHHITGNKNLEIERLKQEVLHAPIDQNKQHISMHRTNELSGALVGQVTSSSSRMLPQSYSARQHAEYSQFLLPSTPSHLQATSPQTSHHSISSPYMDKSNSLSPISIGGKPLQPATSPCILPSPSTPSSISIDPEKHSSVVSPLSATENTEHQITTQNQVLDTIGTGASSTFLLAESSSPKDSQQSHAMGRLIDAVKSLSSKALQASLCEINSVMNVIDRIAETPKGPVGQDLVADIRSHSQDETDLRLHYGTASTEKMRRQISALCLEASSSALSESDTDKIDGLTGQASDTVSTSPSMNKRPRNEHTNVIVKEIKEINRKLVETVLEVLLDPSEVAARLGAHQDGTIVRCSYSAVCFPEMLRPPCAPSGTLPKFLLLLLVLDDYPNSSPIILDIFSDASGSEQLEELLQKAKAKFNISLQRLSQPISLGEMARTWDACSRAVFTEFAEQRGGRSFSSRYGSWENCLTAL